MPKINHSSPSCLGDLQELLEQAMSYGARGGTVEAVMSDDSSYAESFVAALEEGYGWKITRIDEAENEVDQALREAVDPDEELRRLNAKAEAADDEAEAAGSERAAP